MVGDGRRIATAGEVIAVQCLPPTTRSGGAPWRVEKSFGEGPSSGALTPGTQHTELSMAMARPERQSHQQSLS
jgi:hypothetical protein